jgi:hypothetical protein
LPHDLTLKDVLDLLKHARDGDLVVREVVGHHAGSCRHVIRHVDGRGGHEQTVEHDALGVEVRRADDDPATGCPNRSARAVV